MGFLSGLTKPAESKGLVEVRELSVPYEPTVAQGPWDKSAEGSGACHLGVCMSSAWGEGVSCAGFGGVHCCTVTCQCSSFLSFSPGGCFGTP